MRKKLHALGSLAAVLLSWPCAGAADAPAPAADPRIVWLDTLDLARMSQRRGQPRANGRLEIWARPLSDGTTAVGLLNRGLGPDEVTVPWSLIGRAGAQSVRDLCRRMDLGPALDSFTASVPRHGVTFIKVGKPGKNTKESLSWYE